MIKKINFFKNKVKSVVGTIIKMKEILILRKRSLKLRKRLKILRKKFMNLKSYKRRKVKRMANLWSRSCGKENILKKSKK